jgi:hypothetical protein
MKPEDARPSGAVSDPVPADAVLQQLGRVLASPEFSSARSRAHFLEYVVARTLAGEEDGLKEYTIGVEVFDRGPEFDPKSDGVVRTQAGLLRKHLERYYSGDGRGDSILIDVPKGHYVARFHARPQTGLAPPVAPRRPRPAPLVWTSLGVVLAAALFVAATRARERDVPAPARTGPAAEVDPLYAPLWSSFLQPGVSNVLAFGTPQFFTAGQVWVRDVDVNTPAEAERAPRLRSVGRIVGHTLEPRENYTGIGEAYGVYVLSRFFLEKSRELRVVRSRTVSWDNLKHDNVIFLTSARFRTLAGQLTYPSDFVHVLGTANHVENRNPYEGERARYEGRRGQADSVDHAIITVWPAPVPGRRVMVLSGSETWGTQAAAEYVTEPGYLRELNRHLAECQKRRGARAHADFFQVLLRVEIRDHEPVSISYLTHHDLDVDELGASPSGDRAMGSDARTVAHGLRR